MKNDLEILAGTTVALTVSVKNATGAPRESEEGERVYFGIKSHLGEEELLLVKEAEPTEKIGEYSVAIAPTDTAEMEQGRYVYDVTLHSGENVYSVVPPSSIYVLRGITATYDEG